MDADRSNIREPGDGGMPSLSGDGTEIVFSQPSVFVSGKALTAGVFAGVFPFCFSDIHPQLALCGSHPKQTTEASCCVIGLCSVVVDEHFSIAAVAKQGAAE